MSHLVVDILILQVSICILVLPIGFDFPVLIVSLTILIHWLLDVILILIYFVHIALWIQEQPSLDILVVLFFGLRCWILG